jgi:hypothetical protein
MWSVVYGGKLQDAANGQKARCDTVTRVVNGPRAHRSGRNARQSGHMQAESQ